MKLIPLSQGKFAKVDDEDYDRVSVFKWHALRSHMTWYAIRNVTRPDGTRRPMGLHRFLIPDVSKVDHVNGDGLDNQKKNLRPATTQQNNFNRRKTPGLSSRFKGVCWCRREEKWIAQIHFGGRLKHLGYFTKEKLAAVAYDAAAKELFGEFARLNFL